MGNTTSKMRFTINPEELELLKESYQLTETEIMFHLRLNYKYRNNWKVLFNKLLS